MFQQTKFILYQISEKIKFIFDLIVNQIIDSDYYPFDKMCGRMFQSLTMERLFKIAKTKNVQNEEKYTPSYNMCPTNYIPAIKALKNIVIQNNNNGRMVNQDKVKLQQTKEQQVDKKIGKLYDKHAQLQQQIYQNQKDRTLCFMKWGFTDKRSYFIINGRLQQLLNKRVFLNIIQNRCVVIIQGYYEWNSQKQPFSMSHKYSDYLLAAALYTQQNQIVLLTKEAVGELGKIHNRMPVFLKPEQVSIWLEAKSTANISAMIQGMLAYGKVKREQPNIVKIQNSSIKQQHNYEIKQWVQNILIQQIAPYVNSVKQKSRKCIMTLQQHKKSLKNRGLMRFWNKKCDQNALKLEQQYIQYPQKIISGSGQTIIDNKYYQDKSKQLCSEAKKKYCLIKQQLNGNLIEKNNEINQQTQKMVDQNSKID